MTQPVGWNSLSRMSPPVPRGPASTGFTGTHDPEDEHSVWIKIESPLRLGSRCARGCRQQVLRSSLDAAANDAVPRASRTSNRGSGGCSPPARGRRYRRQSLRRDVARIRPARWGTRSTGASGPDAFVAHRAWCVSNPTGGSLVTGDIGGSGTQRRRW